MYIINITDTCILVVPLFYILCRFSNGTTQDNSIVSYSHDLSKFRSMFPTSASFPPPRLKDSPTDSTNVTLELSRARTDSGSPGKVSDSTGEIVLIITISINNY